jgi:UDP-N-acetylmuramoyl-L-alanyl-D-glutamate--2,6-diaminopimelate ligase
VLRARSVIVASASLPAEAAAPVTGIAHDSRTVAPGGCSWRSRVSVPTAPRSCRRLFGARAVAVVSEDPAPADERTPWTTVIDARLTLAILAASFYRHPSDEMPVIGITGTNGKTTTAYLIASIFDAADMPCGVLGTVAYRVAGEIREATRTTPEAPELQQLLREMVDRGSRACAMEVSSHALVLSRVAEITFAAGVFTNLTRDHLDFHGDMDTYSARSAGSSRCCRGTPPAC